MKVLNLTQHAATADQLAAGVVELPKEVKAALIEALTFNELPTAGGIVFKARQIARLANHATSGEPGRPRHAMVGGAPWLMEPLCRELREFGFTPVYAFSTRVVEEVANADGSVTKTATFKHSGFIEAVESN